jgi:hypothetical protein
VGAQVDRLPEGPSVGASAEALTFGAWYRRQRELRGISIFYVAARTKLSPERLRDIEEARSQLELDGMGRATARSLAHAIGADPEEAARVLGRRRTTLATSGRHGLWLRGLARTWVRRGALALAAALAVWLLALFLARAETGNTPAEPVLKPDYVEELLNPK